MKSLNQIVPGVIENAQAGFSKTGNAVSNTFRPSPLEPVEIEKIELALAKSVREIKTEKYGPVPITDQNGNVYKHEFGVIGCDFDYEFYGPIDNRLIEAIRRPTQKDHFVYHLTRLAVHLRDNRGHAISAVFEDVANDLRGISEWAVICACKELRAGKSQWFPATGELVETIMRHQRKIDRLAKKAFENQKGD